MAFVEGKDQYFTFNLLNLTNSLASEVRMPMAGGESDASTIGNNWQAFLQAQANAQFNVSGVWDSGTAATSLDTVLYGNLNGGGTKLYEYMPAGSASNNILYKGNGFVTAYEIGAPVNDKVGFSLTIRVADTPTRSTLA